MVGQGSIYVRHGSWSLLTDLHDEAFEVEGVVIEYQPPAVSNDLTDTPEYDGLGEEPRLISPALVGVDY